MTDVPDKISALGGFLFTLALGTSLFAGVSADEYTRWNADSATPYEAAAHEAVREYCPEAGIRTFPAGARGEGVVGYVNPGVARINVAAGLVPHRLQSVALHECAHLVQQSLVHPERIGEVSGAMESFGAEPGEGWEQNADCISEIWGADLSSSGYFTNCSGPGAELATQVLAGVFLGAP